MYTVKEMIDYLEDIKSLLEWEFNLENQIILDEIISVVQGGRPKRNIDAVSYLKIINKMHDGKTTREFFDMFEGLDDLEDRVDFVAKWAEENLSEVEYDWRLP